jgi:hypothetical protein
MPDDLIVILENYFIYRFETTPTIYHEVVVFKYQPPIYFSLCIDLATLDYYNDR